MNHQSNLNPQTACQSKNNQFIELMLQNRQLLESIIERKQSLLMHSSLIQENIKEENVEQQGERELTKKNQQLLQELLRKQDKVHGQFARQLIEAQMKLQRQVELRGFVKLYEQRIHQMRDNMITKEIELCMEMRTKKMHFMPTKDRMRQFHITKLEELSLQKLLHQHNRLQTQVGQLESQCSQTNSLQNQKQNRYLSHPSLNKSQTDFVKRSRGPYTITMQDRTMERVYRLLQQEIREEKILKAEVSRLEQEHSKCIREHQKQVRIYKESKRPVQLNGSVLVEIEQ